MVWYRLTNTLLNKYKLRECCSRWLYDIIKILGRINWLTDIIISVPKKRNKRDKELKIKLEM